MTSNFPRPDLVEAASRKWSPLFKIPVEWPRSMAYAESRNIPTAVNRTTGAMGVLQILPDTATWLVASLKKVTIKPTTGPNAAKTPFGEEKSHEKTHDPRDPGNNGLHPARC